MLGAHGGRGAGMVTTAIQVSESIVIDAGHIVGALGEKAARIDHIFLSHSHLDHVDDIPFLIDTFFTVRSQPLFIYGLESTLMDLKKYLFNWHLWPDFNQIELVKNSMTAITLVPIEEGEAVTIDGVTLTPFPANHIIPCVGYIIQKPTGSVLYSADTYANPGMWEIVNTHPDIHTVIVDVSFPSHMDKLAEVSKHMTPKVLKEDLIHLTRDDVTIHVYHVKPGFVEPVTQELNEMGLLRNGGRILKDGDLIRI